jgi:hypothetical protein
MGAIQEHRRRAAVETRVRCRMHRPTDNMLHQSAAAQKHENHSVLGKSVEEAGAEAELGTSEEWNDLGRSRRYGQRRAGGRRPPVVEGAAAAQRGGNRGGGGSLQASPLCA